MFNLESFLIKILQEKYFTEKKPITLIFDKDQCIYHFFENNAYELDLYDGENSFYTCIAEKKDDFEKLISSFDLSSKNLIIILSGSNKTVYNNLIQSATNDNNIDFNSITIYFQNILNFLIGKELTTGDWDMSFRHLNKYLPEISNFLIENYHKCDAECNLISSIPEKGLTLKQKSELREDKKSKIELYKREFLLYLFFKDILEHDESIKSKQNYIIEKIITYRSLITGLLDSSALYLLQIFKDFLYNVFSEQVSSFFLYFTKGKRINQLKNLIISIEILNELNKNADFKDFINFKKEISPFLDNINLDESYEKNVKIFNEQLFEELKQIINQFIKYEMDSNRIIQKRYLISDFKNASIITSLEKRVDFFDNKLRVNVNNWNDIKNLSSMHLIYSGIVKFNQILLSKLFRIAPNRVYRKEIQLFEIAKLNNILDEFQNNIYFKLKLYEYHLHFNFLRDIIKLFLILTRLEGEDENILKNCNIENWKNLYLDILLPLDILCWDTYENSRLFWINVNIPNNLEKYMKHLVNTIVEKIKEINILFLNFLKINYPLWVKNPQSSPISVVNVIKKFFKPEKGFDYYLFLIIDCCRHDIWDILKKKILRDFPELGAKTITGLSILPTSTKFARRAIASGKYPVEMNKRKFYWNEGSEFLDNIKYNYSRVFPQILKLHDSDPIYNVNCELLSKNNEAISKVLNNYNIQYCVFNFSDKVSHNFEMSVNRELISKVYSDKIKPLLRKILETKNNPIIYFGTDHGISKCYTLINWRRTNFNDHWKKEYRNRYLKRDNRWFCSKFKTNYNKENLLKIENYFDKWGLNGEYMKGDNLEDIAGYYFGIAYDDLLGSYGETATYYAHGGASFFELLIPFSILSKELKKEEIPKNPIVNLSHRWKKLIIRNPNNIPLKKFSLNFYIEDYHYYFEDYIIDPRGERIFNLEKSFLSEGNYSYKGHFEFNERIFSFEP